MSAAGPPPEDGQDFEDARRGFVGTLSPAVVRDDDGRVVWDAERYAFLDAKPPETADASLWRQARLCAIHGLFEVAEGVYQVRGFDVSNMTLVEGEEGVFVVDPLISVETAAAALALYRQHRGDRPVTGMLYTHSHIDHFGGARGVVDYEDVQAGRVPVLAPEGFLEHAVSENVHAGVAMARRAGYMFGRRIEPGPAGQLGTGIGMATSMGRVSLIPPTREVTKTGEEFEVDGIRFEFQLVPETEAPAEMNFLLPERRALCVVETATHTLHNIVTPRGALVRDARRWARYLDEALVLYGERADVLFAGHHWPTWGGERLRAFLAAQRDLYGFLHDQTLRLLNQGLVGSEIAEQLALPPDLDRLWHARGYYGSLSHNAKAIYQRYLGWFDGNPAHLWEHPPEAAARRYVEYMGGAEAVLERARRSLEEGDARWVAQVVSHVVFADPGNTEARELEARALETLAHGAENATWRNFFLTGARELREGPPQGERVEAPPDLVAHLPLEMLFDALAIRVDGLRAAEHELALAFEITDTGERWAVTLSNGVLTPSSLRRLEAPDATVRVERRALVELLTAQTPADELVNAGRLAMEGDLGKLGVLVSVLDEPDPGFAIVTP